MEEIDERNTEVVIVKSIMKSIGNYLYAKRVSINGDSGKKLL